MPNILFGGGQWYCLHFSNMHVYDIWEVFTLVSFTVCSTTSSPSRSEAGCSRSAHWYRQLLGKTWRDPQQGPPSSAWQLLLNWRSHSWLLSEPHACTRPCTLLIWTRTQELDFIARTWTSLIPINLSGDLAWRLSLATAQNCSTCFAQVQWGQVLSDKTLPALQWCSLPVPLPSGSSPPLLLTDSTLQKWDNILLLKKCWSSVNIFISAATRTWSRTVFFKFSAANHLQLQSSKKQ